MAKKDSQSFFEKSAGVIDFLKGTVFSSIRSSIKENFEQAMDRIEERLLIMQKHMLQSFAAGLLVLLAVLSLVAAGLFYLRDSLNVPRATIALYLAVTLMLVAFAIHYTMRRDTR